MSERTLASIRTPMSFLWGEDDPFGGPDTARQLVARIPGAELELLPGAGHAVWMDDPDHAARVVSRFLRECGRLGGRASSMTRAPRPATRPTPDR